MLLFNLWIDKSWKNLEKDMVRRWTRAKNQFFLSIISFNYMPIHYKNCITGTGMGQHPLPLFSEEFPPKIFVNRHNLVAWCCLLQCFYDHSVCSKTQFYNAINVHFWKVGWGSIILKFNLTLSFNFYQRHFDRL